MISKFGCCDARHKCDAILVQFLDKFIVRDTLGASRQARQQ
jgi:hypothetical protein